MWSPTFIVSWNDSKCIDPSWSSAACRFPGKGGWSGPEGSQLLAVRAVVLG